MAAGGGGACVQPLGLRSPDFLEAIPCVPQKTGAPLLLSEQTGNISDLYRGGGVDSGIPPNLPT